MSHALLLTVIDCLAWCAICWGLYSGAAVLIERRVERRRTEQRENDERRAQLRGRLVGL